MIGTSKNRPTGRGRIYINGVHRKGVDRGPAARVWKPFSKLSSRQDGQDSSPGPIANMGQTWAGEIIGLASVMFRDVYPQASPPFRNRRLVL